MILRSLDSEELLSECCRDQLFWRLPSLVKAITGGCQESWKHQVPKTSVPVGQRLNFTFRPYIKGAA